MGSAFNVQLLDLVGFTSYMATFADPSRTLLDVEPYTYSIDGDAAPTLPGLITQAVSQSFITQMAGDCDFVLAYMSGMARVNGESALRFNPAILVQILDQTSGRTFFAGPSPMPAIAGSGGFPYLPTGPKVIKARSSLKTTAISAQAVSFSGFYFCFHGARLWYG